MRFVSPSLAILIVSVAVLLSLHTPAAAQFGLPQASSENTQTVEPPSPNDLKEFSRLLSDPRMIEWLRKSARDNSGPEGDAMEDRVSFRQQFDQGLAIIRSRLSELASAWLDLPAAPQTIAKIWQAQIGGGETLRTVTFILIFLFVGAGLEWLYWQYFSSMLLRVEFNSYATLSKRLQSALHRALLIATALGIFGLGCIGTFLSFDWPPTVRYIVLNFLMSVIIIRIVLAVSKFALAPQVPELRLVPLSSGPARRLYRWSGLSAALAVFGLLISETFSYLTNLQPIGDSVRSAALAVSVLIAIIIAAFLLLAVWRMEKSAAKTRPGHGIDASNGFKIIPVLLTVLIVFTLCLWLIGASEIMWSVIIIGLLLPTIAMVSRLINHLFDQAEGEAAISHDQVLDEPADDETAIDTHDPAERGRYDLYRPVSVRLSRFVLVVASLLALGGAWGVNVLSLGGSDSFSGRVFGILVDVTVALLIADLLWIWGKTAIDRRMADFGDLTSTMGGEGGGAAGPEARMATLLPILRKILLVTIFIMVSLSVLSSLGINIAPLLAGAGVVGVAIGFGAQALVRDIVSGIFFLLDDAFRVGEYIEMGTLRGTVESMSLRSLRVRHHRGAVHTIPFGELKSLTNYSRDWVIMKMEFRVPFDTDLQLVKKLVKKVGAELKENEMYGKHFIQPLKSQGVRRMEEFNMVIAVKFMSKPGEQWLIRRDAYQKVRDIFEENGIELAQRNVKVEVVGDGELTPETKNAIAGVAQELTEPKIAAVAVKDEP